MAGRHSGRVASLLLADHEERFGKALISNDLTHSDLDLVYYMMDLSLVTISHRSVTNSFLQDCSTF